MQSVKTPRNVFIIGCGRSGTSAMAGSLAKAGYYQGVDFYGANQANPRGHFEDIRVNLINEALLSSVVASPVRLVANGAAPANGQRWLSVPTFEAEISAPPPLQRQIQELTRRQPFCFKDPRFSFTIAAWLPSSTPAVAVVCFRDPAETVQSMLNMCRSVPELHSIELDMQRALQVWKATYEHILSQVCPRLECIFLHFRQLGDRTVLRSLAEKLAVRIDTEFFESALIHKASLTYTDAAATALYQELCDRACYAT